MTVPTVHTVTTLGPGRGQALAVPARLGTMSPVGVFFDERPSADEQLARMRHQWRGSNEAMAEHLAALVAAGIVHHADPVRFPE